MHDIKHKGPLQSVVAAAGQRSQNERNRGGLYCKNTTSLWVIFSSFFSFVVAELASKKQNTAEFRHCYMTLVEITGILGSSHYDRAPNQEGRGIKLIRSCCQSLNARLWLLSCGFESAGKPLPRPMSACASGEGRTNDNPSTKHSIKLCKCTNYGCITDLPLHLTPR